jgi:hypothetical protein
VSILFVICLMAMAVVFPERAPLDAVPVLSGADSDPNLTRLKNLRFWKECSSTRDFLQTLLVHCRRIDSYVQSCCRRKGMPWVSDSPQDVPRVRYVYGERDGSSQTQTEETAGNGQGV